MQNQKVHSLHTLQQKKFESWEVGPDYEIQKSYSSCIFREAAIALQKSTDKKVLIQKIRGLFQDMSDTIKVLRELVLYRKTKHPHLLQIIEIIEPLQLKDFDTLYVVYEYQQSDVQKLFKSPIHIEDIHIKTLLYNILVGLKYLHSSGLIHRNVKPANILINEDYSVRICGFKSAKSLNEICKEVARVPEQKDSPKEASLRKGKLIRTAGGLIRNNHIRREHHVFPRTFFRSPDLIFLKKSHTSAVDVWSAGCMFAELLGMKKENAPTLLDRSPLFILYRESDFSSKKHGWHRSEISAENYEESLERVFSVIGTPKDEDLEFITDKAELQFLQNLSPQKAVDWFEMFPGTCAEAIDLLKRMLEFNPKKRISIDECLYHPFLVGVKDKAKEQYMKSRIELDLKIDENITMKQLRELYLEEINYYKKNSIL